MADVWAGRISARLDTQMTTVATSLYLALIVHLCLIAAVLFWRRRLMGPAIAYPLLGCIVGLVEIVGPVAGFVGLGLGRARFLYGAYRGAMARISEQLSPETRVP